jgi:macrolide-specific efflux system membrane fusion protein
MKIIRFILKPWVMVALIAVLATGGYFIYRSIKSADDETTYKTATVGKGTITATVSGTGNLFVENSADITSSVSGEVKDLSVKIGDSVVAGQTLFKVVNSDLDLEVSKAYSSLLQAQQTVVDVQNEITSLQNQQSELGNDTNATDEQKNEVAQNLVKADTSLAVANINLQSAQSSYNTAKKTAGKRTITAPIAGTITAINTENGDTVGSGGTSQSSSTSSSDTNSTSQNSSSTSSALIVISDLSSIKASVDLNEVDASVIKVGQTANMTFDAVDDLSLTGKISYVGVEGTETSGVVTYPATITFDALDGRLKPQMSVSATITTEIKQDILYIPNSAVKSNDSSSYVLLMKDGKPSNQTIEVGIANDSYTEITSGLSEGDTVVTQTITASASSTTNKSSSSGAGLGGLTGGSGGGPPAGMMGM